MKARYGDEHGMGFTISLTRHHCHADGPNRFPTTLTCGDCNSADGAAKRRLGLPEKWSFAPNEIRQFVSVKPHSGKTTIDYQIAQAIYDAATILP